MKEIPVIIICFLNVLLIIKKIKLYNKIIEYKNFKVAILKVLKQELLPNQFIPFWCFIQNNFLKNKDDIFKHLNRLNEKYPESKTVLCNIYSMECNIDYKKLIEEFNIISAILDKKENINEKSK